MMSAPFLNDGVYRNKREWGATVLPDNESRTWVYFFHAAPSEKIAHFFEINPTIVHSDKGLKGVVGISGTMEIPIAAINDIAHRYQSRGLEGFTVVTGAGAVSTS
jgi:hypothetical protein